MAAADAGADAIGLVFYPRSPRAVTINQAIKIAEALPPLVSIVSLFVDPEPDLVEAVVTSLPVDLLQFHGDETAAFCGVFQRPWLKALRVRPEMDLIATAQAYQGEPQLRGLLLDAWVDGVAGGTGTTFDWSLAQTQLPKPVVLAGGLNPDNVGAAIAAVQPAGVDVSGGVEAEPGIKDAAAIQRFVAAVRAADQA